MEGLDLFNPVPALTEEDSSPSPSPSPPPNDSDDDLNSENVSDDDNYTIEEGTVRGGSREQFPKSGGVVLRTGKHQMDGSLTLTLSPSFVSKGSSVTSFAEDSLQTPNFQVQKV